ncbi:hypothetical protein NL676_017301 [Syzygium grande]|nr:hypothetical protein NL676_017301 [Syzygium grande]
MDLDPGKLSVNGNSHADSVAPQPDQEDLWALSFHTRTGTLPKMFMILERVIRGTIFPQQAVPPTYCQADSKPWDGSEVSARNLFFMTRIGGSKMENGDEQAAIDTNNGGIGAAAVLQPPRKLTRRSGLYSLV